MASRVAERHDGHRPTDKPSSDFRQPTTSNHSLHFDTFIHCLECLDHQPALQKCAPPRSRVPSVDVTISSATQKNRAARVAQLRRPYARIYPRAEAGSEKLRIVTARPKRPSAIQRQRRACSCHCMSLTGSLTTSQLDLGKSPNHLRMMLLRQAMRRRLARESLSPMFPRTD